MNARQKAKKYKRMYEELLKSPVKFKVEQHKIDTLRFERFYPVRASFESSGFLREVVLKDIAEGLASNLDKYIDYRTEFCTDLKMFKVHGEIMLVNRLNT